MITVLFFGRLRELLECEHLVLELGSIQTLAQVRHELMKKGELWQEFLNKNNALGAVNLSMAEEHSAIADGDEVAFFPPVTGG